MNILTTIGSHVRFEHDGKTLTGTIKHILPCLENGRKHAVIELDGTLRGCMYKVKIERFKCNPNRLVLNEIADAQEQPTFSLAQPRFKRYTAKHKKQYTVPLDETKPTFNIVFLTGAINPFEGYCENNRRYFHITESDRVFPL